MNKIMTITFHEHIDADKIASLIASGEILEVAVYCDYSAIKTEETALYLNDFSSGEINAFIDVSNKSSFIYESGSYVFIIRKNEKSFDLSGSFIRDTESIDKGLTPIPSGTSLLVRFEIPGFEVNNFREIPLYYDMDFDPSDILLLQEIGVELSGNGLEFSILNSIDCKISFAKPETVPSDYIIDFSSANEIIIPDA